MSRVDAVVMGATRGAIESDRRVNRSLANSTFESDASAFKAARMRRSGSSRYTPATRLSFDVDVKLNFTSMSVVP